jgi:hypothetical protein
VVIAGLLMGVGLFLGLRDRPASVAPTAPTVLTSPSAANTAVAEAAAPSTASAPSADASATAESPASAPAAARRAAAVASLESQRKAIVEQCVKPVQVKTPSLTSVKLTFNVVFAPDGKQIGRGVSEDRRASNPEVTACVQQQLKPLVTTPSRESLSTDIEWTLP